MARVASSSQRGAPGVRHEPLQQPHRAPAGPREQERGDGEAAHAVRPQARIARGRQQQQREPGEAAAQHAERRDLGRADIASQHAQRWHPRELQHGRQTEREQQRQAHAQAQQRRRRAGQGQAIGHEAGQQPHEDQMQAPAEREPDHAPDDAEQDELQRVHDRDARLRLAEHAQHRAVVEVALREIARRDGHGHGGQQGRQQRHQAQELLGPIERLAHLGPSRFEGLDVHASQAALLQVAPGPTRERADLPGLVGPGRDGQAPTDPARGLHQAGRLQVGEGQHETGRERAEPGAAVRLDDEQPRQRQRRVAERDRVADLQPQGAGQTRIHPNGAARRRVAHHLRRCGGGQLHPQRPPQRIGRVDRFHRREARRAALRRRGARHAGERRIVADDQAAGERLAFEVGGERPVGLHDRIPAQQLRGIAHETGPHAVGEEPHGRERGDRQHDRPQQQPQLARGEVAEGLAARQAQDGGGARCTHGRHGTPKARSGRREGLRRAILPPMSVPVHAPLPRLEIQTARLLLTPGDSTLAPAVREFQRRNRRHFERWDPPTSETFYTLEAQTQRLQHGLEAFLADTAYRYWLVDRSRAGGARLPLADAVVVGSVHFSQITRGAFHNTTLGYALDEGHVGRGLMTEALTAAIAEMFSPRVNLHRIQAAYRPENHRSEAVLERQGFRLEGVAKDYLFIDGAWRHHRLMALVNPAFVKPEGW